MKRFLPRISLYLQIFLVSICLVSKVFVSILDFSPLEGKVYIKIKDILFNKNSYLEIRKSIHNFEHFS